MKMLKIDAASPFSSTRVARLPAEIEGLRYATGETSLSAFLVAYSDSGVRAILLGDERPALVAQLRQALPGAALIGAEDLQQDMAGKVEAFLERPWTSFEP